MSIYIGADHGGFELKRKLKKFIGKRGYKVTDKGNLKLDPNDDFPDFAAAVAREVSKNPKKNLGILICRSGAGMDMVANKFKGVLAMLGMDPIQVKWSRNDDAVNVLVIPGEYLSISTVYAMTKVFLETSYDPKPRFERRLEKVKEIEKRNFK